MQVAWDRFTQSGCEMTISCCSNPASYISLRERFTMAGPLRITVDELKRRMDAGEDFTIIDVRRPDVWAESDTKIPEAIRIPLDRLEENWSRIPKTRPIVTYCT